MKSPDPKAKQKREEAASAHTIIASNDALPTGSSFAPASANAASEETPSVAPVMQIPISSPSPLSAQNSLTDGQIHAHSLAPQVAGQRLDGLYELKEALGEGGMGAVYRARDKALHRTVAVKVMHEEVAANPIFVRRFYKEAQIAAQLEHPGIVPTYNIELGSGGKPRLAMRLIRGSSLEGLIEKEQSRGQAAHTEQALHERLELFVRACDAVQFAHEHGVVHRDLKPENIMVGPHRDAYVMDWGLATLKDENGPAVSDDDEAALLETADSVRVDDDPRATRHGQIMGTVLYMPPEQAIGDHDVIGPAADQFALGMILQELVTLAPAREVENLQQAISSAVLGSRNALGPKVPRGLRAIIEKATAAKPEDRFSKVCALSDEVRRFMRDEELLCAPDPFVKKLWRKLSEHQALVLSFLFVMVVIILSLVIVQIQKSLDRQQAMAKHAQLVASQLNLVTERAQYINARARGVETEIARLTGAVKHALKRQQLPTVPLVRPTDLLGDQPPPETQQSEAYGQVVSFSRAVTVRAPSANPELAHQDEQRLALVEEDFQLAYDSGGFVKGTAGGEHSTPLQSTYVATAEGVFLHYPGLSQFASDYDPRTRPWYQAAAYQEGVYWGALYSGATGSGVLMPCNRAIHGEHGEVLAVVGIEFHLRSVKRSLPLPTLRGYQQAWLLNSQGQIIASSEAHTEDSGTTEMPLFESERVRQALQTGLSSGQVEIAHTRYLYSRIPALDWVYLVSAKK